MTAKVNTPLNYIELPYRAFGSESESIIWPQHWQWDDPDNHKPVSYDIRVIVYKGDSLQPVKNLFPIIPEKKRDYRFLSYERATDYLNTSITDIEKILFQTEEGEECESSIVYFNEVSTLYRTLISIEKAFTKN